MFQELLTAHDAPEISIAIVELDGTNAEQRNNKSDTYYFILDGEGTFTIDGNTFAVKKGDLALVPKGSAYFDSGNLTMLAICNPRFDADSVEEV